MSDTDRVSVPALIVDRAGSDLRAINRDQEIVGRKAVERVRGDRAERQAGRAIAEPQALDVEHLAEMGIGERDGADEGQHVGSGAAVDAPESRIADTEDVVTLAADQHVGAAVAKEHVVAAPADHDVGGGVAGQRLARGRAGMGDMVGRTADGRRAEHHIAVAGTLRVPGAAWTVGTGRPDDEVIEAVAVDVAGGGNRAAGLDRPHLAP